MTYHKSISIVFPEHQQFPVYLHRERGFYQCENWTDIANGLMKLLMEVWGDYQGTNPHQLC